MTSPRGHFRRLLILSGLPLAVIAVACTGTLPASHGLAEPTISPPANAAPVSAGSVRRTPRKDFPKRSLSSSDSPAESPPVCRNSYDPRCGPFFWDPAPRPPNDLSAEIVGYTPEHPFVGDTIVFMIRLRHPDAGYVAIQSIRFGNRVYEEPRPKRPCVGGPATGPWTPPSPIGVDRIVRHSFRAYQAGVFDVIFTGRSGSYLPTRASLSCWPGDPYAREGTSQTIKVVVIEDLT
jgi:hypothetical protein